MNGYMLQKKSKHLHRTVERHADVTSVIGAVAFRKQLKITKENKDVCQGSPRTSKINEPRDFAITQHDKTQNSNVIMN